MDPEMLKLMGDLVPTSTEELLFNPAANAVGLGVGGILTWIFQKPIEYGIIKKKEFADLATKTSAELNKIPEEYRDDSKLGLTIKTLESSKYSLDSEELRSWFARLVAKTVDKRVNTDLNPLFPTVLSNMSSDDAQFFKKFDSSGGFFPIGFASISHDGSLSVQSDYYLDWNYDNEKPSDFELVQNHLNLLQSFGIIEYNIDASGMYGATAPAAKDFYQKLLTDANENFKKHHMLHGDDKVVVIKGYASTTILGIRFANSVLPK